MTYPRDFDEFDSARLEDWIWLERVARNWGELGRGWLDEVKTRHAERILELTDAIKRDSEWLTMAWRVREASVAAPSELVASAKLPPDDHAGADRRSDPSGRSHDGISRRSDNEARKVREMVDEVAAAMTTLRKLVERTPTDTDCERALFHPPLAVDGNLPTALAAAAELLHAKAVPAYKADTIIQHSGDSAADSTSEPVARHPTPTAGALQTGCSVNGNGEPVPRPADVTAVENNSCDDTSEPTRARPPIPLGDRDTHSTSTGTQYDQEDITSGSTSHVIVPAQHIPVGNVPDDAPGASLPTLLIPKISLRTPDGQYVWNGHQRIMVDGAERAVTIDLAVSLRDLPLGSPYEPESPPLEHARLPEVETPAKERIHVVPAEIETPVTRLKRKLNGTAGQENGKRVRISS